MHRMQNEKVRKALSKPSPYGSDVDMDRFESGTRTPVRFDDIDSSKEFVDTMSRVGVTDGSDRAGSIVFVDNGLSHCSNHEQEGVDIMSTKDALKKFSWAKDYYWKAVSPDSDKYTAKAFLDDSDGFFIRVRAGYHVKNPIQTCALLNLDKSVQNVHNIIIIEGGASAEIITGCSTTHHSNDALHVGVSEIYINDDASLLYSMIHNWGNRTTVRPEP